MVLILTLVILAVSRTRARIMGRAVISLRGSRRDRSLQSLAVDRITSLALLPTLLSPVKLEVVLDGVLPKEELKETRRRWKLE